MKFSTAVLVSALLAISAHGIFGGIAESIEQGNESRMGNEGCKLDVCFALDGSGPLSERDYKLQKWAVKQIVGDLSKKAVALGMVGVQFGSTTYAISTYSTNTRAFTRSVMRTKASSDSETFLTGGLTYCFGALRKQTNRRQIVVFGSGRNTIGSDAEKRASQIGEMGIEIFTVLVGGTSDMVLMAKIANKQSEVLKLQRWKDVRKVTNSLTALMCN